MKIIINDDIFIQGKRGKKIAIDKYTPKNMDEREAIERAKNLLAAQLEFRNLTKKYEEDEIDYDKWMKIQGRTVLHYQAYFGLVEAIKTTIKYPANSACPFPELEQKDGLGFTPLDYAEQQGHTEVAELLKQHGGENGN